MSACSSRAGMDHLQGGSRAVQLSMSSPIFGLSVASTVLAQDTTVEKPVYDAVLSSSYVFTGRVYHTIKQFVQYNYHLNLPMESGRQTVWPLVLLMSDTCVMWKSTMDDRERWVFTTFCANRRPP